MASPKKLQATVATVISHSDTVIEYTFIPQGRIPSFKPGQFLHLAIDPYDPSKNWPDSRVFSIANAPESNIIRIIISIKGKYTARMAAELVEGSVVWLKFPYGSFTFESTGHHVVLIAGGTGISPYVSFLEHCLVSESSPDISLYYGVSEEQYIIFGMILEKCKEMLPLFNYTSFCEGPIQKPHQYLRGGMINVTQILSENKSDSDFYISGPPLMIEHIRQSLLENQISPGRIFLDEW